MTIDEMDLVRELGEVEPLRAEAYEGARDALRSAVADEQRTPLVARPEMSDRDTGVGPW